MKKNTHPPTRDIALLKNLRSRAHSIICYPAASAASSAEGRSRRCRASLSQRRFALPPPRPTSSSPSPFPPPPLTHLLHDSCLLGVLCNSGVFATRQMISQIASLSRLSRRTCQDRSPGKAGPDAVSPSRLCLTACSVRRFQNPPLRRTLEPWLPLIVGALRLPVTATKMGPQETSLQSTRYRVSARRQPRKMASTLLK